MKRFSKGDFVVEYVGDLLDSATAKDREKSYSHDEGKGNFMFYFRHNEKQFW